MRKTAEDVETAVRENQITEWQLRRCSICDFPLRYLFRGGAVLFDPGCDCTRGFGVEPRSYESVAECFNIQSSDEVAERMWQEFISSK